MRREKRVPGLAHSTRLVQNSFVFDRPGTRENRDDAVSSSRLTNDTCRNSETSESADRLPVSLSVLEVIEMGVEEVSLGFHSRVLESSEVQERVEFTRGYCTTKWCMSSVVL